MRKIYWNYPQYKCIICKSKLEEPYVQLRVFDWEDPKIADSGSIHGFLCFDCALKLFKEKLNPEVSVVWK